MRFNCIPKKRPPEGVAQVREEVSPKGPRGSGRSLFDRCEWQAETLGYGPIRQSAAMDIEACAQMRVFEHR